MTWLTDRINPHPVLTALPLPRKQREQLARQSPVVVMGRGHSGTRLLAGILLHLGVDLNANLARHRSGDMLDQSFKQHIRTVASHSVDRGRFGQLEFRDLNRFQKAARGYYRRLDPGARPWGWKFPETYLLGPYVRATFPRARYLHLLRDGRDLAFKQHLTDLPQHRLARAILRQQRAMGEPHHLQAAKSWALQVELFDRFRRELEPGQLLEIRFERLLTAPVDEADRICRYLGLDMTEACLDYLETVIDRDKTAQYLREDPRLVAEVERAIGPVLERFGYADRGDWG
jgi:Sulfotransferase family